VGKAHPVEMLVRVTAFVEEGYGHRGEPSTRHWSKRDGERAAFQGFAEIRKRHGEAEAGDRLDVGQASGQTWAWKTGRIGGLDQGRSGSASGPDARRDPRFPVGGAGRHSASRLVWIGVQKRTPLAW